MGRPKIYDYPEYRIPRSVVKIVLVLCADYKRRAREIKADEFDTTVLKEYVKINNAIDSAVSSVEPALRKIVFSDLLAYTGWDNSPAALIISKEGYYRRRRKVIYIIAKALSFI